MTDKRPTDYAALLKRSLVAIDELEARLATAQRAATEPVAIIGLSCRFPGGADSPEAYWDVLARGADVVTEVPKERWDAEKLFDPDPDAVGKSYSRWGSFVDNVDMFDADLFGVSPREAGSLDPQQRLLLEVSWEAIERSGIAPSALMGSSTAAFVGITTHDYGHCAVEMVGMYNGTAYSASGSAHSMASGRLAYVFGLNGPNAAVDTACSASHVAIHMAMQALRNRESNLAVAGGVNLTLHPMGAILTSRARMMSFTGRCKTFDASADGYVRGEGCGVIVLKRLSDAQRDGDNILAVIRGSALNQDGRSSGLTAPNGRAQEAVLRAALDNAGLRPDDISYVEAHGTGTSLGDPIEMKALAEVFSGRSPDRPLHVASVKTNIGHLEAAAGMAGLIKTVMALQHRAIPAHLHLKNKNPLIPWDRFPVRVPTQTVEWTVPEGELRRAGVSSFGFSGSNGHVVVEEAPRVAPTDKRAAEGAQILVLSAQTPQALTDLATRFATHLRKPDAAPLANIARTVATGRSQMSERLAVVANSNADAADLLAAFADGDQKAVAQGRAAGGASPEVVFLFTGQGAQYAGMGSLLYDTEPVFRAAMDECAKLANPHLKRPLLDVIRGAGDAAGLIDDTAYTQPALVAIEYSLAQLWKSWGVEPTAVMGHSVGEYTAAIMAGVFSLADGLKLIATRARLMSALPRNGSMIAVFSDETTVRAALEGHEASVSVAASNGPTNTVISGVTDVVEAIVAKLAAKGIEFQRLAVSHAFHSPLMQPMLAELESVAASIKFHEPTLGLISNVTGRQAGAEVMTPGYWRTHVREAVRFGDSIAALLRDGYRLFLEVGPAPTLMGMARRCPGSEAATWVSSLRKGRNDRLSMLEGVAQLHVRGQRILWPDVFGDTPPAPAFNLPTYPFQRRRFWIERTLAPESARMAKVRSGHPLLGGTIDSPLSIFQSEIGIATHPWLAEHRIFDFTPFPATGFLELAMAGVREVQGTTAGFLRDISIREGLMLPEEGTISVQVVVTPGEGGNRTVQVFSRAAVEGDGTPSWRLHVSATHVGSSATAATQALPTLASAESLDAAAYYEKLISKGAGYGPAFQGIKQIETRGLEAVGEIRLPDALGGEAGLQLVHPALLDAAFQLVGVLLPGARDSAASDMYMPVSVERYTVNATGVVAARCYAVLDKFEKGADSIRACVTLFDDNGAVIAEVVGLTFRRVTRAALMRAVKGSASGLAREDWLFELAWRAIAPAQKSPHATSANWVLLADEAGVAGQLAERLKSKGGNVTLIRRAEAGDGALTRAVAEAARKDGLPLAGVVSFWPLDVRVAGDDLGVIQTAQRKGIEGVMDLVKALRETPARAWLVTRGAQPTGGIVPDLGQAPLVGLGNVIGIELQDLKCVRIDLDSATRSGEADLLFDTIWHADAEDRIALRDNARMVARMVPGTLSPPTDDARLLEITARGQLDNLQHRATTRRAPMRGEVEIRVHATGLNFRDVLNALGMYPGDPGPLGNECSGIVTAVGEGVQHLNVGDEVISMVDRSFATYVVAPANMTVRKPAQISFVEAATLPVTFLTAAYALQTLGRIKKGDRVLIHAVTGGVGMAAVQIAKLAGAEIIGTAGSPAKRELARSLGVHHIADSRSLSFEADVQRFTGGKGVDIVLNSLAGDFIPASLRVTKSGGRFIEIGKTGIWNAQEVGKQFPGVEYHALYLGEIAAAQPHLVRGMLEEMLPRFVSNELQPLPQRVYPIERAQEAFRFMAQGQHTGKIVITQRQPVTVSGKATYLITGGLGGLGLACARWLADLGARSVVLLGRRAPADDAKAQIAELEAQGVDVLVAPVDVSNAGQLRELLDRIAREKPPLRGVLHAAGSVDDGMLSEQTWQRFERVMAPKVQGTWNLHTMTRHAPLDFFVMFSSGAALLGSPGQSNYAAANSFMDSLAYVRHSKGQTALSVNWGSWSEVGMAAEVSESHHRRWAALGLKLIDPVAGVQMLQQAIQGSPAAEVAALPIIRAKLPKNVGPFLSELVAVNRAGGSESSGGAAEVLAKLSALPAAERPAALVTFLSEQVIRVFALSASHKIDPQRSLMEMGMDSLMAMELRNRLQSALSVPVSVAELLEGPTLEQLAETLAGRMSPASAGASPAGAPVAAAAGAEKWEEGAL